jgi:hypothetical protein
MAIFYLRRIQPMIGTSNDPVPGIPEWIDDRVMPFLSFVFFHHYLLFVRRLGPCLLLHAIWQRLYPEAQGAEGQDIHLVRAYTAAGRRVGEGLEDVLEGNFVIF